MEEDKPDMFGILMPTSRLIWTYVGVLYLSWIGTLLLGESLWLTIPGLGALAAFEIHWWWVNRTNWRYYAVIGTIILLAILANIIS